MDIKRFCRTVQSRVPWPTQSDKIREELDELGLEISRQPYGRSTREKLLEERCDVEICLKHLDTRYQFTDAEINAVIKAKMARTLDELDNPENAALRKIGERRAENG